MRRLRPALLVTLALLCANRSFAEPPGFAYQGWLSHRDSCVVKPPQGGGTGSVVFGGDSIFLTEFCKPNDAFICFFTRDLHFAVPRALGTKDRWELRGHTFEVAERNVSVQLLGGEEISGLVLIRTPPQSDFKWEPGKSQDYFLYSPSAGLVAFSWQRPTGGASVVFWSRSAKGFGSVSPSVQEP